MCQKPATTPTKAASSPTTWARVTRTDLLARRCTMNTPIAISAP
jgi:hypothetical protein